MEPIHKFNAFIGPFVLKRKVTSTYLFKIIGIKLLISVLYSILRLPFHFMRGSSLISVLLSAISDNKSIYRT
jgi:hypothetical protein